MCMNYNLKYILVRMSDQLLTQFMATYIFFCMYACIIHSVFVRVTSKHSMDVLLYTTCVQTSLWRFGSNAQHLSCVSDFVDFGSAVRQFFSLGVPKWSQIVHILVLNRSLSPQPIKSFVTSRCLILIKNSPPPQTINSPQFSPLQERLQRNSY